MPDAGDGSLAARIVAHAALATLAVTAATYVTQTVSQVPFSPDLGVVAGCSVIAAVFAYLRGIDDDADEDIEEDCPRSDCHTRPHRMPCVSPPLAFLPIWWKLGG